MPEGHTIHRLARRHTQLFAGHRVRVSSPQGRFAQGADVLTGRTLTRVDAYGKHLFYRWERGEILHVHLGLIGGFVEHLGDLPAPTANTRLRLAVPDAAADLSGPMVCRLVDPGEEAAVRARLGPDPLRRDGRAEDFVAALARTGVPIGAALLDQGVVSGIGNVYRAEALFLCGIHPSRPARALGDAEARDLWETLRRLLRAGVRSGRIVTVHPEEVGARRLRDVPTDEGRYVYRRAGAPCHRCGAPIRAWELAGRTISACSVCQAR